MKARENIENLCITDEGADSRRIVIMLAIPAILEQLSHIIVQYVDAAMVGGLGAYATAAVGINSSTTVLLGGIQQAIGVGFSVQVAMAIGSGDRKKVYKVTQQAILAAVFFGVVMSLGMQIVGKYSPIWLGAEPDVIPSAVAYIRIVAGASVFQAVSITVAGLLRGAGNTKTPFYMNLIANIINIVGNFFLIPSARVMRIGGVGIRVWGAGLGVSGAAFATASSMAFSGVGLFAYICIADTPVKYLFKKCWKAEKEILKSTARVGVPIALERFVLALGQLLLTAMVANLGTTAIASHYIVNTVATISYETSMGFSSAGTTLVAQCVGAGKRKLAYQYAKLSLRIGISISVAFSMVIILFTPGLVRIFTAEAAVINQSVFISRMDAVSEPLFGISTVLCGVFRGYGDTKYPFIVTFLGILVTRLLLGLLFGYALGLGLVGIWMGIFVDIVLRAVMCLMHLRKYRVTA